MTVNSYGARVRPTFLEEIKTAEVVSMVHSLAIPDDEAECLKKYGCFASFFEQDPSFQMGFQLEPTNHGTSLPIATVAAVQQVRMRVPTGDIKNGWLYLLMSKDKPAPQPSGGISLILQPEELVRCYHRYGYVALPGATCDIFPLGNIMRFTSFGTDLPMGVIIGVQKFRPTWNYLFIAVRYNPPNPRNN